MLDVILRQRRENTDFSISLLNEKYNEGNRRHRVRLLQVIISVDS